MLVKDQGPLQSSAAMLGMWVSAGVEALEGPTLSGLDRPFEHRVLTVSKCYLKACNIEGEHTWRRK